ncbi:hypothetical protein [Luteibacter aegosomatissinici]|uniref:hypothetical protein n=1 Tax=Luteibacter aegosomatissinici TaxID=2911539 RepID=UPI001FF7CF7E|nr:hypothetical protein [Luteibacter aegosomatissinici]UPG95835.1 hypothetical protein L2Y97_06920 [Luteibacter aegosomatissinici]
MDTVEAVEISITEGGPDNGPLPSVLTMNALAAAQQGAAITDLALGNQVSASAVAARAQVSHQDALNRLRQMILSRAVMTVDTPGPKLARSTTVVLTSSALAQDIADLKASTAAFGDTK